DLELRYYLIHRCDVDYRDPPSIKRARRIVKVFTASSAEVERGFSMMKNILDDKRNKLQISNLSSLMTIKYIGPEIEDFNPMPYVEEWILKHKFAHQKTK